MKGLREWFLWIKYGNKRSTYDEKFQNFNSFSRRKEDERTSEEIAIAEHALQNKNANILLKDT